MRAYNDPGAWWGWHGWQNRPQPMSVSQIIAAGTMSSQVAALLWLLLANGRSIIVSSLPQRAGKTTVLTALTAFFPEPVNAYFSRGMTETFDVPPIEAGRPTYLMINELSDHLPIYTWGDPARRAFALLEAGYSLAATMHAHDAAETLALLERGLGVPAQVLGRLDIVLSLRLRVHTREAERHVSELALVCPDGADGYRIAPLGMRAPLDPQFELLPGAGAAIGERLGRDAIAVLQETEERAAFLDGLVIRGVFGPEEVHGAIRSFDSTRTG